jgi:beta-glucanase (GH16 family)
MVPRTARRRRPHRAEIRRARRRRHFVALAVVVVIALVAVGFLVTREETSPPTPAKGALLLDEGFAGGSLNTNRWNPCYHWATDGCTNLSNNELQWYVPGQAKVADGVLSLEADRRRVTGIDDKQFDYVSGLISGASPDRTLFAFKYGYVESRVRLPKGQGLWSALWMLPTTRESKPEVDIFETVGEQPDTVQMHTHWEKDGQDHQRGHRWHGGDMTEGWHTFGLQWEPDSLTWYVDGQVRWRVTDTAQIPHEDMYLLTNLAVGGALTKTPNADTPFPSSLRVDYVRVWGLP